MPRRVRWCVCRARRSAPSKLISPSLALRMPMTLFMSVVLPAPLRPMRPSMVPVGSSSETPRRICTALIDTLMFCTLSMRRPDDVAAHLGVGERGRGRRIGDDAPVVEGEHALREAAHDLHVVLDEEHGRAFGLHRGHHHFHDAELLFGRDAAGGLIE